MPRRALGAAQLGVGCISRIAARAWPSVSTRRYQARGDDSAWPSVSPLQDANAVREPRTCDERAALARPRAPGQWVSTPDKISVCSRLRHRVHPRPEAALDCRGSRIDRRKLNYIHLHKRLPHIFVNCRYPCSFMLSNHRNCRIQLADTPVVAPTRQASISDSNRRHNMDSGGVPCDFCLERSSQI